MSIVVNVVVLLAATISLDRSSHPNELNPLLIYCLVVILCALLHLPSTILHELGHVLAVGWFRRPVRAITIGSGPPILR
ncbi:MAG TPA: hypothetical protein VGX45_02270, partial [Solirubrobacteraceae bacterium]|nr:hypothetical protein [Solirubrobacteraceae bacterium]